MKRLLVLAAALCAGAAPLTALAQIERPSYEKPLSSEAVRVRSDITAARSTASGEAAHRHRSSASSATAVLPSPAGSTKRR